MSADAALPIGAKSELRAKPTEGQLQTSTKFWYGFKIVAYLALAGGFGVASFYSYIHGERLACALCGVVGLIPLSRMCSLGASLSLNRESKDERKWWADHLQGASDFIKPKGSEKEKEAGEKSSLETSTKLWYAAKIMAYLILAGGFGVASYYSYQGGERAACALVGATGLIPLSRMLSLGASLTIGEENKGERRWWAERLHNTAHFIRPTTDQIPAPQDVR